MLTTKYSLNQTFSESFNGIIWKIDPDKTSSLVAIELRDPADKQVSFAILDLEQQKVCIKNLRHEERWYCGIELFYNDLLFLHGYTNESLPEHKGIIAYNTIGEKVWENYQLSFYQNSEDGIIAYNPKIEPRRYVLLDHKSGEQIQQLFTFKNRFNEDILDSNNLSFPQDFNPFILQVPEELRERIQSCTQVKSIEKNGKSVVSWYENSGNNLDCYLVVFGAEKIVEHFDKIIQDLQNPLPDSYFLWKNFLIYVKNRSEFVSLLL